MPISSYSAPVRAHCARKGARVHAWVRGEVTEASEGLSVTPVLVTYNPFRVGHFVVRATGERIDSAPLVALSVVGGKPVVAIMMEG